MKHYISDAMILISMFLLINAIQTYYHENIHAEICTTFGGTPQIKYNPLMQGGKTFCTTTEGGPYHIMNDINGYNTSAIIITVFMLMTFLAMHFSKKRLLLS